MIHARNVPIRFGRHTRFMLATVDISWPVVTVLIVLFAVICFLAVLWSRREWNTRKIRVGMFLEREYKEERDAGEAGQELGAVRRIAPPGFLETERGPDHELPGEALEGREEGAPDEETKRF